jgi:cytochrome c oxidase assembly factor CtaG
VDDEVAACQDARTARHQVLSPGLAAAGLVILVVVMVPPLATVARRYLFVESIQFCVLAIVAPALIGLGTPWRPALRRGEPSFVRAAGFLGAWVGACLLWRLPPVLDGLARHPALSAAELATLLPAGTFLWLELVDPRPLVPRLTRPRRAAIAALAMWSIWVIAYVLGFARGSVVHAYDGPGTSLATVADQEITAGVLWLVTACCFLPVVFTSLLSWLGDRADPGEEPRSPGVRGWARGPGRSAGQARR